MGVESLAYYDAIAPILSAESIDWNVVFKQSRYDRADMGGDDDAQAYVNCPFDESAVPCVCQGAAGGRSRSSS